MTKHVPARPRVVAGLPVLRRRAGELQIGLDPRHAAVVEDLPDRVVAAARGLTGDRTAEELAAGLGDDDRQAFSSLLRALHDQGLVEDATTAPARLACEVSAAQVRALATGRPPRDHTIGRSRVAVAIHGDGRLAVAVGCLLAAAGVGWVHVSATGTVRPEDLGAGYVPDDVGVPRFVAARRALRRAEPTVRTAAFTAARRPDLVVLADRLVPGPERVDALMAAGLPHLLVRVRDAAGIVGPLVVPGVTSCLRCADLHRCDRDACWPQLATQLAGHAQSTDLAGTHATAAFAAAQVLDAVAWSRDGGHAPATCEMSVELDPPGASVRHRAWSAHPRCACGAAARRPGGPVDYSEVAAHTGEELRQSDRDGDAS